MVDSDKYVGVLSRHIHLQPAKKNEIISELENHLEDKASDLEELGIRRESAQSLALDQLGDPVVLARQIQEVHSVVSLKDLGLAVVPHLLLIGLVAFHLCDDVVAVASALGLIVGVTWFAWRTGNPGRWSYPWLAFSVAAPAIVILMALLATGKSLPAVLTGGQYPINPYLVLFFGIYILVSIWIVVRVVYRIVQHDWLLIAFSALPIAILTGWALIAEWRGDLWSSQPGLIGGNGTAWILVFLTMAAVTAGFLKFGRHPLKTGYLLFLTGLMAVVVYATLMVNYDLVPVQLTMVAFGALLLVSALRKPLSYSIRVLQSILQMMLHLVSR